MIGVSVQPSEQPAARELFELCKTPWEFYRSDGQYEVLLCTSTPPPPGSFPLTLVFSGASTPFDAENNLTLRRRPEGMIAVHDGRRLPLYEPALTIPSSTSALLREEDSRESLLFAGRTNNGGTVVRVGYDLFAEIHRLLTVGQPAVHAGIATLELHLALLRDLITRAGVPLVEIPPVPAGYDFMVCLTHDIDHPVLTNHRWDHTMFGFLHRATLGSLVKVCRGRLPLRSLLTNWAAVLRLPFMHLGLAKDFWREFARRYLEVEAGLGATYFFIPEGDNPGQKTDGASAPKRASRYELAELRPQLRAILAAGNEVGLHGLDAWRDAAAGRRERTLLTRETGAAETGVRMHWLYFDRNSPAALDQAGFSYDSTVGYNETVGFRAGTTQVYRPLAAVQLLELPLHVMDTALFYPHYLDLDEARAFRLVGSILDRVAEFGGVVTFNWHDRSLAPERLWGNFYAQLLAEMKSRRAWFPTAGQAVAWFRQRRRAAIEMVPAGAGRFSVRGRLDAAGALPGLKIRIHRPLARAPAEPLATGAAATFHDVRFDNTTELAFSSNP